MQLLAGSWEWRKGGTQKKDGFWVLVRRHVSRRATTSANIDLLREMVLFFQWLYWRAWDQVLDAARGRHAGEPCHDMMAALGRLRCNFVGIVGQDRLQAAGDDAYEHFCSEGLDDLLRFARRCSEKTLAP